MIRHGCGTSVEESVRPKIDSTPRSRVPDPVSYTATLPIGESTAAFLSGLSPLERRRAPDPARVAARWAATRQAVLVLRWFLDGTRVAQLAARQPAQPLHRLPLPARGIDVLAAVAPGLHGALLAARTAGHTHVHLDGTLIRTDRSPRRRPDRRGGSVVVGQAPPPRREHPGRHRPGRLAAVDLAGAARPRARHHLRPHP